MESLIDPVLCGAGVPPAIPDADVERTRELTKIEKSKAPKRKANAKDEKGLLAPFNHRSKRHSEQ